MRTVNARSMLMRLVVGGLLTMSWSACDAGRPSMPGAPTAPSASPAPPPPVTVTPFPPLSGAATTYRFSEPLENFGRYRVSGVTEGSSFVLFESGGCYLQYEAFADRPYRGRYEQDGGRITFYFSERSNAGDAIGTLKSNLLEIRYSEIMQHSDFENAVYKRVE